MSGRRKSQGSRGTVVGAGMLLGVGVIGPPTFAQGSSVWVDPPPVESTTKQSAPQLAPAALTPPDPVISTLPPSDPSQARESEPDRSRILHPRELHPPATFKPQRPRLGRPEPKGENGPGESRRAPQQREEIGQTDHFAPAPWRARKDAAAAIARPSFECRHARTAVERAICADPVLAAKDRRMALLYEQAGGSRYRPVDPSQWSWLAARNRCARVRGPALEGCLHRAYDDRIAELTVQ
jgi:hypothetical protein